MRSLDELANEICTLAGHINARASCLPANSSTAGVANAWTCTWLSICCFKRPAMEGTFRRERADAGVGLRRELQRWSLAEVAEREG